MTFKRLQAGLLAVLVDRRSRARAAGVWALRLAAAVFVLLAGLTAHQILTWPDVATLESSNPETTAFMETYRQRVKRQGEPLNLDWRWVPYLRIGKNLPRAVLVSEDIEFLDHEGFSGHEIRAALEDTLKEGKSLRGASTLTQQLAKNLWLTPSRNPWRKVKEALLTRELERRLSKRRILELYLNVVEFGPGIYGAEAAARHYFGTSANALGEAQAAALAAALPNPTAWHPGTDSKTARRRAERILRRMVRAQWLKELL